MPRGTRDTVSPIRLSLTGLLPSLIGLSRPVQLSFSVLCDSPTTPTASAIGLGSFRFARRYSGNRFFFLFLRLLRCFSSPGCLCMAILFTIQCSDITRYRLPHSDISGSMPAYGSPKLFAVNHVLHRLLAPRHPPYALSILTYSRFVLSVFVIRHISMSLPCFLLLFAVVKEQPPRDKVSGNQTVMQASIDLE